MPEELEEAEALKLTINEREIIDHLAHAFNKFVELPSRHPSDAEDFARHIHILQRHVMARLPRRIHPEMFGSSSPRVADDIGIAFQP